MPGRTESESSPESMRTPSHIKTAVVLVPRQSLHPLVKARAYGAIVSLYIWSIWCCDHYQLDTLCSVAIIVSGAWVIWTIYPSTTVVAAKADASLDSLLQATDRTSTSQPSAAAETRSQEASSLLPSVSGVSTAVLPLLPAGISVKPCEGICDIAKGETAARDQETNGVISGDAGVQQPVDDNGGWAHRRLSFPESPLLPCEPPPPYDKTRASLSSNTVQGQGETKAMARQYLWTIFMVQGLGICGCLLFLGVQSLMPWVMTWEEEWMLWTGAGVFYAVLVYTAWSKLSRGSRSSAQAELLELQSDVWSKSGVTAQLESGSVSSESSLKQNAVAQESSQPARNERRNPSQRPAQQEEDPRHPLPRPPQFLAAPSSDITKSVSPLPAPSSRSSLTFSLRSLKHEIHMWALSMFYLAPVIPKCLSPHQGNYSGQSPVETFQSDQQHGKGNIDTDEIVNALEVKDIPAGDHAQSQDLPNVGPQGRPQRTMVQTKRISRKDTSEPRSRTLTISPTSMSPTSTSPSSPTAFSRLTRMTLDTERTRDLFQIYKRKQGAPSLADPCSSDPELVQDDIAFVVRSNTLPTVRVGLYGAGQDRLWASTGSVHVVPSTTTVKGSAAVSMQSALDDSTATESARIRLDCIAANS